jgi:hypothetical protein
MAPTNRMTAATFGKIPTHVARPTAVRWRC